MKKFFTAIFVASFACIFIACWAFWRLIYCPFINITLTLAVLVAEVLDWCWKWVKDILPILLACLVLQSCIYDDESAPEPDNNNGFANAEEALVYLPLIEDAIINHLRLLPPELTYEIILVADMEEVNRAYHEDYGGKVERVNAFYSQRNDKIYIPWDMKFSTLKHEIGHAIVDHYFTEPVPSWLHENIAEEAENAVVTLEK